MGLEGEVFKKIRLNCHVLEKLGRMESEKEEKSGAGCFAVEESKVES